MPAGYVLKSLPSKDRHGRGLAFLMKKFLEKDIVIKQLSFLTFEAFQAHVVYNQSLWFVCTVLPIIIIYPLTARVVRAPQMLFTTSFLHFSLFSTALWDFANFRPVHSLVLSSHLFKKNHLFIYLSALSSYPSHCVLQTVLVRPDELETWYAVTTKILRKNRHQYYLVLRFYYFDYCFIGSQLVIGL